MKAYMQDLGKLPSVHADLLDSNATLSSKCVQLEVSLENELKNKEHLEYQIFRLQGQLEQSNVDRAKIEELNHKELVLAKEIEQLKIELRTEWQGAVLREQALRESESAVAHLRNEIGSTKGISAANLEKFITSQNHVEKIMAQSEQFRIKEAENSKALSILKENLLSLRADCLEKQSVISNFEKKVLSLNANFYTAEAEVIRLTAQLDDQNRLEVTLNNSIAALTKEISEISTRSTKNLRLFDRERKKCADLEQKCSDLEALQATFQSKIEAIDEVSETQNSEKKSFSSFRSLFSKKNEESPLSAKGRESEHARQVSTVSIDSCSSNFAAIQKASSMPLFKKASCNHISNPVSDFAFSLSEEICGELKIPKGGKVKKGWKLQFAVIKHYNLIIYDDEVQTATSAVSMIVDLSSDIFLAGSVSQNELIHANSKDIDSIFKLKAANSTQPSKDSKAEIEAEQRQLQKLKAGIELEEKMQKATEKILAVTTDAQKVAAIAQLDASTKRMRSLKDEYSALLSKGSRSTNSSTQEFGNLGEAAIRKKIEEQLEDETKKRAALHKVAMSEKRKSRDLLSLQGHSSKDVEVELLSTDRSIAKLKEGLEILNSADKQKIQKFVLKHNLNLKESDTRGHFYITRQFFKPTDCAVCHETLFDTKNQGLECSGCKIICHKNCQTGIDISCASQCKLASVPPLVTFS